MKWNDSRTRERKCIGASTMARCRIVGTNEGLTAREPMDKTVSIVREANRVVVQVEYLLVKLQALGRVVCQCFDRRRVQRGRRTTISRTGAKELSRTKRWTSVRHGDRTYD